MKCFNNMKIGTRLITSFIVVALISVIIGVLGVTEMKSINKSATSIYNENLVPLAPVNAVAVNFEKVRIKLRDHILDTQNYEQYEQNIKSLEAQVDKSLLDYNTGISSAEERTAYTQLQADLDKYKQQEASVLELSRANRDTEAVKMMNEILGTLK